MRFKGKCDYKAGNVSAWLKDVSGSLVNKQPPGCGVDGTGCSDEGPALLGVLVPACSGFLFSFLSLTCLVLRRELLL